MAVELKRENGGTTVTVKSGCLVVSQLLDWGKNKQNVEQLFAQLSVELGVGSAH